MKPHRAVSLHNNQIMALKLKRCSDGNHRGMISLCGGCVKGVKKDFKNCSDLDEKVNLPYFRETNYVKSKTFS